MAQPNLVLKSIMEAFKGDSLVKRSMVFDYPGWGDGWSTVEKFPDWSSYTKEPEIGAMRLPRTMRRASHYGITQPSHEKNDGKSPWLLLDYDKSLHQLRTAIHHHRQDHKRTRN